MEKQKLIDSFHKNSVELVKVHLEDFKGRDYVDVRVWYLQDPAKPDEQGNARPTHKGITLNFDLLDELLQALQKAQKILAKKLHERPVEPRSPESKGQGHE